MTFIIPKAKVGWLDAVYSFPTCEYWFLIFDNFFHSSIVDNVFIKDSGTAPIDMRPHFKSTLNGCACLLLNSNIKVTIAP
eukprot:CAMPEP_0201975284 /NCGR_PEP_ID=MMETSP0904-20121228/53487_1 /ASSEMBLY_ACC=CAM_ASM_000553 /TAXON_ID=420261 /ORGANISM="Thalassiosira antarctica, Strain CCMP982" /LENGTH=79 /DNA_ID=CAMNT_0048526029 /DNA_START=337 /DNA_END=576 /DNA_ORIENTATION=+